MAVPDFQSLMLPFLKLLDDGREHTKSEVIEALAVEFKLNEGDRKELLPSGRQSKFDNRVGWARTYLKKAGLLDSTGRGSFRISERGHEALRSRPERIDIGFLGQYPEFVEFRKMRTTAKEEEESEQTPEEVLESGYQSLRRDLAQELLAKVKGCSPKFFEQLVVDLLVAMGYGGSRADAGQAVGQSRDGGVDGIIKEDRLGLDVVYIQAKRWEEAVGRPVVQGFAGSLEGLRAKKGVMITTSRFTEDAQAYADRIEKKIILVDGEKLAQLMFEYGIGVAEVAKYTVKKIDSDYFGEDE